MEHTTLGILLYKVAIVVVKAFYPTEVYLVVYLIETGSSLVVKQILVW
jgi:hypothetical protein